MLEHMLPHLFWSAKAGYAYSPVDTAFYVGAALIFGAYWGAKLPRNITRKVCKFLPLFVLLSEFLALLIYFRKNGPTPLAFSLDVISTVLLIFWLGFTAAFLVSRRKRKCAK